MRFQFIWSLRGTLDSFLRNDHFLRVPALKDKGDSLKPQDHDQFEAGLGFLRPRQWT
jgi:hypothetical protein